MFQLFELESLQESELHVSTERPSVAFLDVSGLRPAAKLLLNPSFTFLLVDILLRRPLAQRNYFTALFVALLGVYLLSCSGR